MTERDADFINERFLRVWDRFAAMDKAAVKADTVFEAYRHASNEVRGVLADQAAEFLPRQEYTTQHTALSEKINSLDTRLLQHTALSTGREAGFGTIGYVVISVIVGIGGLVSIASLVLNILRIKSGG